MSDKENGMEEEIRKLLESDHEGIKRAVNAALKEQIKDSLQWSLREQLTEIVDTFVKKKVAPEIVKDLEKSKNEIILAMHDAVVTAAVAIGKQIQDNITKNVTGYRFKELISKLVE